jgi:predicted nucleotidyltransferase
MAIGTASVLPSEASTALETFRAAVAGAAGANLVNITVYGSAARGRYDPETSDLNVVVVLRDAGTTSLLQIADAVHDAERANRIESMLIARAEIPRLAIAFPTKILDIQRTHVVLFGEPVFAGIEVEREDVRSRAEQELRNLALRLRRRLVAARHDEQALALAADDAASTLAVNLRALLFLRGVVPSQFQPSLAIYDQAAKEFGLDGDVLDQIRQIHKGDGTSMSAEQFGALAELVGRAADAAANVQ